MNLKVESDSLFAIQCVTKVLESPINILPLVLIIRSFCKENWCVQFSHIWGEPNFSTDFLTKAALSMPVGVQQLSNLSSKLHQ